MHLGARLGVFLVRKLGVPGRDEVATGAIADGGLVVVDEDVIRGLTVLSEVFRGVAERESREMMRREQAYCVVKSAYREGRPSPDLMGRTVILVDDGLATGASMRAAVEALRGQRPVRVVVAIPAAPESTCRELKSGVDRVVRATTPSPFLDVGEAYGGLHPDQGRGGPRLAACGPVSHRVGRRGPSNVAVLRAGAMPEDEQFFAHENARTVKNAAEYYRAMFGGQVSSWNLRDRCMVETLDEPPRSAAG